LPPVTAQHRIRVARRLCGPLVCTLMALEAGAISAVKAWSPPKTQPPKTQPPDTEPPLPDPDEPPPF